jgi:uncharacterized protein YutD
MGDFQHMFESKPEVGFEILINNVRDAVLCWDQEDFFDTFSNILDGIDRGVLKKEDYEIRYSLMGGIYDPRLGEYNMQRLITKP